MRGPSSSHCAAAVRIGRLAKDLMGGKIREVLVQFDPNGSLASTHESQGSDLGLFAGLLGWDMDDDRLVDAPAALWEAGISVRIEIADIGAQHPNTYKLTLKHPETVHHMTAVSTGGGMVEVVDIDGIAVCICGDFFETLIFVESAEQEIIEHLKQYVKEEQILFYRGERKKLIEIKSQHDLDDRLLRELKSMRNVIEIARLKPVMPILSRPNIKVPFITCKEILDYNKQKEKQLWELAILYERARGDVSEADILEKMGTIVDVMRNSVTRGIAGTRWEDRILGYQCGSFKKNMENRKLLEAGMLNTMILYAAATMEAKSAMGVIVAAPTAGSCGVLPGACLGAADFLNLPREDIVKALLAAGMIGVFISEHSTFAAELCGCQAECGAGSGMAAAALVTLAGGTLDQALAATSMALQNIFGMVCDPVANRVEVPCLGKNILAVSNALASANMALADFDPVIPLDEVIEAMDRVGRSIPCELRCTALGGLSVTKTSLRIQEELTAKARR
ncbi:MAG: L-serine ammonia-lyase, iron-sulfur-dependent, subunit alpha [Deltaproteobacteria bacterium]|nr:L-serine ammonia-lyase, iron-sulfur-dependent, subunit alpha [Deltaproteobacteria bacterium]MBW2153346.1 L-serine ammonia-lyase, iron-sulfur-dependent, subunit alpha [Deltaproteobacteria bacterium]